MQIQLRPRAVRTLVVCLASLALAGRAAILQAQSPENVAIVVNDDSPDSQRIAEHYARTRQLPAGNVLHIRTSTSESIERDVYVRTIEQPLGLAIKRAGLHDRIHYLVLTKGIPLRIAGTTGVQGTLASVDSELTLLYRRLTGVPVSTAGKIDNPYYLGDRDISFARRFSHRDHDIYLVTRIDAYTVDQALALIDRAQTPATDGKIVLDARGTADAAGDRWMQVAAKRLTDGGHAANVVLENSDKPSRREKNVLGYYAWGAADPGNRVRSVEMTFAPGAIAANLASFDARTFHQPADQWRPNTSTDKTQWFEGSGDTLIGDLIRDGVTGVSGQVGEAYLLGAVRPEILLPAYLSGFSLAEAFYLALPTLSWQAVVIGDPLCAVASRKPLSHEDLEDATDATTGLPGLFSKRRLTAFRGSIINRDIPEVAVPLLVRSEVLLEGGDNDGARRALEDSLKAAPRTTAIMVRLAQLEEQAGNDSAAIAGYRRVLELEPANIIALNNLAYALAVRRDAAAEAVTFATRAAALAPRSGSVQDTLGWVEHLAGNDSIAATVLGQAVLLDPDRAEIRLHAAIVYAATGSLDRAAKELKEALRLDSSLEERDEVRQLRERIQPPPRSN